MLQESCGQPEVAILHLSGALILQLSSKILLGINIFLKEEIEPCTKAELLFLDYIPSLPWLATVWTYTLELKEDHGSWMKPIFYK